MLPKKSHKRKRDAHMKILIVNDDSITAPGISLLAEAAMPLGEVTVVAPAFQCSALSQKLTLRETLTLEKVEDFPVPASPVNRMLAAGFPARSASVLSRTILRSFS